MIFKTKDRDIKTTETLICGILNATPDSFSDGGDNFLLADGIAKAKDLIDQKADMIDIGGESTRPDSTYVEIEEEISRVVPLIEEIRKFSDIPISVDTWKAEVADECLKAGANIINDITGLLGDPNMAQVIQKHKAGAILMFNPVKIRPNHPASRRFPKFGPPAFSSKDLEAFESMDILDLMEIYLKKSLDIAKAHGIEKSQIMLDPGIGFGLSPDENLKLIKNINLIKDAGYMTYIGVSRKRFLASMIKDLGLNADLKDDQGLDNVDLASAMVTTYGVSMGVDVIRVHSINHHLIARQVASSISKA